MLWKGHRKLAELACVGLVPDGVLQQVVEYSVYPDRREVWKECRARFGTSVWISPACPPPPPVHHTVKWSFRATAFYARLARKAYLNGDWEGFAKYFGIASHFLADAVIEPYEIVLGKGQEWEYHAKADPISDFVASLEAPPEAEDWRKYRLKLADGVPVLLPEDVIYAKLGRIRGDFQRTNDYRAAGLASVSAARSLCRVVLEGFLPKPYPLQTAIRLATGIDPSVWVVQNKT